MIESIKLNIRYAVIMLFLTVSGLMCMTSCSDDDNASGIPEITCVRIPDPEVADSTFTQAFPGLQIVIIGHNLQNAHHVYINDQSVFFNPTMNTDHSIILTIPTEESGFVLTPWDNELKSEIRVETPAGVATYSFKVLSPNPEVNRIAAKYPRNPGDEIKVHGFNFLDVKRAYFTDVNPFDKTQPDGLNPDKGTEIEVADYSLELDRYLDNKENRYRTTSVMTFSLPVLPYTSGYFVVECQQGISATTYAALPPAPVITDISSTMPVPGERVTILGQNILAVESISFGGITIPGEEIEAADTEDSLIFTMPSDKPTSTCNLRLTTSGGFDEIANFYPYETVLINFDDKGFNEGWGPDAQYLTADGTTEPATSDGQFALIKGEFGAGNWWGDMIYWRGKDDYSAFDMPGFDIIPADTPAENLYLVYEVYMKHEMKYSLLDHTWQDVNGGQYNFFNYDWGTNTVAETPFPNKWGDPVYNEWYAAEMPMSKFFAGMTYGDIVNLNLNRIWLMMKNPNGPADQIYLAMDNIRLMCR